MSARHTLVAALLLALALPSMAVANVWTETRLFGTYATGDRDLQSDWNPDRKEDLNDQRFGGQFTFFFPSVKDADEFEREPVELRTFLQHPCSVSVSGHQRDRTLETAGGDNERKDTRLGGAVELFTPTRNFATGLGASYSVTQREYSSPGGSGSEYDDTRLRVQFSQYFSRFFRLQLAYLQETAERTDSGSTYEETANLGELGLKASFGNVVSLELAGGGGAQERGSSGANSDFNLARARSELGVYFGRHVSLLLGGSYTYAELDEDDSTTDYTEKGLYYYAQGNVWFGGHFGVRVRLYRDEWESEQDSSGGGQQTDTWAYTGVTTSLAVRF